MRKVWREIKYQLESHKRTIMRALTYRLIGITIGCIITFAITHNNESTIIIPLATEGFQTVVYYVHERLWLKVKK